MFEHFLTAYAAHAAFDVSKEGLKRAFDYVVKIRPDLAKKAHTAESTKNINDLENVFREAVGVIVAEANNGTIHIDQTIITALNGVKFDHQHGTITIGNTTVSALILVTGGSTGATGTTNINENTSLRSKGTSIEVGKGCGITITGNAHIKQS